MPVLHLTEWCTTSILKTHLKTRLLIEGSLLLLLLPWSPSSRCYPRSRSRTKRQSWRSGMYCCTSNTHDATTHVLLLSFQPHAHSPSCRRRLGQRAARCRLSQVLQTLHSNSSTNPGQLIVSMRALGHMGRLKLPIHSAAFERTTAALHWYHHHRHHHTLSACCCAVRSTPPPVGVLKPQIPTLVV